MSTSSAISQTCSPRKVKRVLTLFSRACFPGGMRLTQYRKPTVTRGNLI